MRGKRWKEGCDTQEKLSPLPPLPGGTAVRRVGKKKLQDRKHQELRS